MPQKLFSLTIFSFRLPLLLFLYFIFRLNLVEYKSISQELALIPDALGGIYLRRLWYKWTLRHCGKGLTILWLSTIINPQTEIGDSCYIGQGVIVGFAKIGNNVMISSQSAILSGVNQHNFVLSSSPMNRQQGGGKQQVHIGNDVWIGAACLIGASVPDGSVVGLGSGVVSNLAEVNSIYAGTPASFIRHRPKPEIDN